MSLQDGDRQASAHATGGKDTESSSSRPARQPRLRSPQRRAAHTLGVAPDHRMCGAAGPGAPILTLVPLYA